MIFIRCDVMTYEAIRAAMDAARGYPDFTIRTLTAITPAAELPSDEDGRVYAAMPAEMLPEILAAGSVEQISENAYLAMLPQPEA